MQWEAINNQTNNPKIWQVIDKNALPKMGDRSNIIADNLTEEQAKLIANAPRMKRVLQKAGDYVETVTHKVMGEDYKCFILQDINTTLAKLK